MCAKCPQKPEEYTGFLGNGVTNGCEPRRENQIQVLCNQCSEPLSYHSSTFLLSLNRVTSPGPSSPTYSFLPGLECNRYYSRNHSRTKKQPLLIVKLTIPQETRTPEEKGIA